MPGAASLIARAYDARTVRTRIKHARAAIAIDPDALDAYVLLASSLDDDSPEPLTLLREGAARGRSAWAREVAHPDTCDFWLDHDTRPFMRLLHLLALELWETGDTAGAIAEAEGLLRLNPNDNQGIRELLTDWYGAVGAWDALRALLARYPDDWSTSHHYARWLLAFRDGQPTADALADALEVNPHVPRFLADLLARPDEEGRFAGFVTAGGADEAHDYAQSARAAWAKVPGAVERLVRDAATRSGS